MRFGEGARPHLCMDEWNRSTPVRRRLSLTQAARGKPIPTGLALVSGTKARSHYYSQTKTSPISKNKDTNYFARLLENNTKEMDFMRRATKVSEKALKVSHHVIQFNSFQFYLFNL